MTGSQRIALNVVATYGRSVVALACGVFTSRWLLAALGETDYGLFGLVGGLIGFVTFLNLLMATAVSRFYATDLRHGQEWFSVAVIIHLVLPLVLVAIGLPLGEWAVRDYLTIPADRVSDCLWVWRFGCIGALVSMMAVPWQAMFTARQEIAELSIYSLVMSVLHVGISYALVTSSCSHKLVLLAAWAMVMVLLPSLCICVRGHSKFSECRFGRVGAEFGRRVREMMRYVGWTSIGIFASLLRGQGLAVLVNKCFGPGLNAAYSVANNVGGQATGLSAAMEGAFSPAIMNAYGAGDLKSMRTLSYRADKYGLLLALWVVIPLSLELRDILVLWLKNPPSFTAELCWCVMASIVIDKSAIGQMIAVNATGRVAAYQCVLGTVLLFTLPLAGIGIWLGYGAMAVGGALVSAMAICAVGRVLFARRLVGLAARPWIYRIFVPVGLVTLASFMSGIAVMRLMESGIARILLTALVSEVVFCTAAWLAALDMDERAAILRKVRLV